MSALLIVASVLGASLLLWLTWFVDPDRRAVPTATAPDPPSPVAAAELVAALAVAEAPAG